MSYTEKQIAFENGPYWVLDLGPKGFEVYRIGITHSIRCAIIGYPGSKGLERAKVEINRRIETVTPDPFWPFPTSSVPLTPCAPPVRANPKPQPLEESPL